MDTRLPGLDMIPAMIRLLPCILERIYLSLASLVDLWEVWMEIEIFSSCESLVPVEVRVFLLGFVYELGSELLLAGFRQLLADPELGRSGH